jgi:hypothetical protein
MQYNGNPVVHVIVRRNMRRRVAYSSVAYRRADSDVYTVTSVVITHDRAGQRCTRATAHEYPIVSIPQCGAIGNPGRGVFVYLDAVTGIILCCHTF